ncbi:MAG: sodium:solute symporter family protein [Bacteroidetes bacterium]|nr:sodium:solute symporter family protein [Bacteroidota bacterium]
MEIHWLDLTIFIIYILSMLGIGLYFFRKNSSTDEYYVGGRNMKPWHIGLSVVATDVGGGFSIGLGGLGFATGISGSWMLFTGLLGAWMSAVFLIPRIFAILKDKQLATFPGVLGQLFNPSVALAAGIISLIGYLGFTSSQLLAGAKLASATFPGLTSFEALIFMGAVAVIYTVLGGMKAVVYTDTAQWMILFGGLFLIGIPYGYHVLGGWEGISAVLPASHFSLSNISVVQILNWFITIVPVWFIGMTLYQRIFACGNVKSARKAWYIAGVFEWPFMAFLGVVLGLFARAAYEQGLFTVAVSDPEMGLPLFLRNILPAGLMGLMMASYFSAVLSTADSCLMAASGNAVADLIKPFKTLSEKAELKLSQYMTLALGLIAVLLAAGMQNVLELMLLSYAFMVSGLLIPVLGGFIIKEPSPAAALIAMIGGGLITLTLSFSKLPLPYDLDANIFGLTASFVLFILTHLFFRKSIEFKSYK